MVEDFSGQNSVEDAIGIYVCRWRALSYTITKSEETCPGLAQIAGQAEATYGDAPPEHRAKVRNSFRPAHRLGQTRLLTPVWISHKSVDFTFVGVGCLGRAAGVVPAVPTAGAGGVAGEGGEGGEGEGEGEGVEAGAVHGPRVRQLSIYFMYRSRMYVLLWP